MSRGASMREGDQLTGVSLLGPRFTRAILGVTTLGDVPAIIPRVSGRAWITGLSQLMLNLDDPWPELYRLFYTWPLPQQAMAGTVTG